MDERPIQRRGIAKLISNKIVHNSTSIRLTTTNG